MKFNDKNYDIYDKEGEHLRCFLSNIHYSDDNGRLHLFYNQRTLKCVS